MKRLAGVFLISLVCFTGAFAQLKRAYESNEIIWLGVDFSHATYTGLKETPVKEDLEKINMIISNHPKKFNLGKLFNKKKVIYDLRMVTKINESVNPNQLIDSKPVALDSDSINNIVLKYQFDQKEGIGLVLIAENLNIRKKYGTLHVTFIDLETKQIIYSSGMQGKTGKSNFNNQWANAACNVMRQWEKANLYY